MDMNRGPGCGSIPSALRSRSHSSASLNPFSIFGAFLLASSPVPSFALLAFLLASSPVPSFALLALLCPAQRFRRLRRGRASSGRYARALVNTWVSRAFSSSDVHVWCLRCVFIRRRSSFLFFNLAVIQGCGRIFGECDGDVWWSGWSFVCVMSFRSVYVVKVLVCL